MTRVAKFAGIALAGILAIMGCTEGESESTGSDTSPATNAAGDCTGDEPVITCAPGDTTIAHLFPDAPVAADGEPIKLGTINQETGAAGAFPELTQADQAAIDFVNIELGGIDARPIELVTCDTAFSPAGSQQCAQKMVDEDVVAVVGGIDVFGDGIDTLAANGIPYIGGIPVSFQSVRSPLSFQFSGGTWGAVLGFAQYAADQGAERVSIVYGNFGPIADSAQYGERALQDLGIAVKLVPTPVIGADWVAAMTEANAGDPDVIIALTADTGCVPAMQTAIDLGVEADVYLTGACAAPKILAEAGDAGEGRTFNVEAEIDPDDPNPDTVLYQAVVDRYGDGLDPQSAGTVSFRSFINLYAQMRAIGGNALTGDAIAEAFRAAVDEASFMGHPYTCDGEQLAGLPAMCAPQQTLAELRDGQLVQVTDWIDVGALAS